MPLILKVKPLKPATDRVLDAMMTRCRWRRIYCTDCHRYHRLSAPTACVRREVTALLRVAGLIPASPVTKPIQATTETEAAHG